MTTTPESAEAVLGTAPELPRPTDGIVPDLSSTSGDHPAPAPPPSDPAPPADLTDRRGTRWDPAIHESPPRLNSERVWARRRGNAQRKAAGKPFSGAAHTVQPVSMPAAEAQPGQPPSGAPQAPQSVLVDPGTGAGSGPSPGATGSVVDGVPTPETRPIEAYESTAAGITAGSFGVAAIVFGKAWDPDKAERTAWVDAWKRVLHHYQVTPFGPLVEIVILLVSTIAKRRDDPETKERVRGWFSRLRQATGRGSVADAQAATAPAAPPQSAAAEPRPILGWR